MWRKVARFYWRRVVYFSWPELVYFILPFTVEQNYELPEAVLKEMGVEIVPINRAKVGTATVDRTQPTSNIKRSVYETINITVLRRGIIGVNKIGYVL